MQTGKHDNHALTRVIMQNCCDSAWVDGLIRRGADPNKIVIGSRNVLHYLASEVAYYDGVDSVTVVIIKSGVDLNAKDEWGKSPLHVAINEIWRSGKTNQGIKIDIGPLLLCCLNPVRIQMPSISTVIHHYIAR